MHLSGSGAIYASMFEHYMIHVLVLLESLFN